MSVSIKKPYSVFLERSLCFWENRRKPFCGPEPILRSQNKIETGAVYHLHGKTGRFTVWADGRQNSGLVNFAPESGLSFVGISSFCQITAAKAWKWNTNFRLGYSSVKIPFLMFQCSRKCYTETTQKFRFHLPSKWIFRKRFVNAANNQT